MVILDFNFKSRMMSFVNSLELNVYIFSSTFSFLQFEANFDLKFMYINLRESLKKSLIFSLISFLSLRFTFAGVLERTERSHFQGIRIF
jgi:hypothetical protein